MIGVYMNILISANRVRAMQRIALMVLFASVLTACGGGGGGSSAAATPATLSSTLEPKAAASALAVDAAVAPPTEDALISELVAGGA